MRCEAFRDVKQAMPLIAKYVQDEGKKHFCNPKCNLFQHYQERLKELII